MYKGNFDMCYPWRCCCSLAKHCTAYLLAEILCTPDPTSCYLSLLHSTSFSSFVKVCLHSVILPYLENHSTECAEFMQRIFAIVPMNCVKPPR